MKNILKDLIFRYFHARNKELDDRASILMYHDIAENDVFFTVSPRVFESQCRFLIENNFILVSLSELVRRLRAGEDVGNHVVLTLNNGFKSSYKTVFPLLKKYKIPATVFITPDLLDAVVETSHGVTFETLSLGEIKEMKENDLIEFMPQTQHSQRLTDIIFEKAVQAIKTARSDVESLTGNEAPIFAYPKGSYTKELARKLRMDGWLGAVTTREGLVHKNTDLFVLPRNAVDSRTTLIQFKGKLSGAIERYVDFKSQHGK